MAFYVYVDLTTPTEGVPNGCAGEFDTEVKAGGTVTLQVDSMGSVCSGCIAGGGITVNANTPPYANAGSAKILSSGTFNFTYSGANSSGPGYVKINVCDPGEEDDTLNSDGTNTSTVYDTEIEKIGKTNWRKEVMLSEKFVLTKSGQAIQGSVLYDVAHYVWYKAYTRTCKNDGTEISRERNEDADKKKWETYIYNVKSMAFSEKWDGSTSPVVKTFHYTDDVACIEGDFEWTFTKSGGFGEGPDKTKPQNKNDSSNDDNSGGGGGGGGISIGGGGSSSSGGSGSSSGGNSDGGDDSDGDDSSDDTSGGDSDSASNSGFYIRPTSRAKTCEAGSQEVVFYNGVPDKVSYSGNGITSATLGGTVNFSANESTEARSFAVTWTVTGSKLLGTNDQSGTLTITQAGTGELAEGDNADKEIIRDQITGSDSGSGGLPGLTLALAIDPSHYTATASGAVFLVAVETLYGWSWATSASWVSLSRYSDYYALVVVDANTAEAARSGTVVFTDEAGSKATLYIAQAGTGEDAPEDETPWLNLFPTTLYGVDNTARQWTVYTTASEKFMLHPATTIPDWLTVTLPYRDGAALTSETELCEDYLQIVATRNGDTEPRYAQFDFCFVSAAESSDNPEIAATLYIGQAAYVPPDNSLNFEFIEIGAAAESLELGGVCRDGWTWTVDTDAFPDWIDAVSIATGTGNDEAFSVELAIAENTSSEPRWATFGVVFTNPDTGDVETKSVTVYQRAADNSDPQDIEIVSGSELEFDYSGGSQTIVVKTSGNAAPIVSATGDEDAEIVLTESAVSDEGSLFTYTVTLGENTLTRALSGSFTFTLPAENGAGWMVATWKQGIEPPKELRTYVAGLFVNRSRLKFFCRKWSS
ncbi:MAG: hypothetical protein LUD52_06525 [Opitutae bacterium]|nr:hypothetical protein [Opitutae bacterium]